MIGELIDHYRVLELVGRGAMGIVYKALDVNLDRTVAIKVMSAEARSDPDFVERFRQEARVQGALNHPNVALLFDYFVHDGAPVAVMEFIDGESLEQLIRRRGGIPAHEAIPIFKQALRGVAAAHRAGIIHRDLKPANLMVTRDDIVKVMDFGIAKRQGVAGATKASTSIGSPYYMAPEQILGSAVDCRTDVYALGITLYELLSGYRPFNTRGKAEYLVLDAHVNDLPEPPTVYRFGIPQPIVDAVMRSLAKDPDARFQSAAEFMNALPDEPSSGVAVPHGVASNTVTLEYSAPRGEETATRKPGGTMAFEYAGTQRVRPHGSMEFDYSAGTVWQQLHRPDSPASAAPAAAAAVIAKIAPAETALAAAAPSRRSTSKELVSPGLLPVLTRRLRAYRAAFAAVLVGALALGALTRHPEWVHAMAPGDSTPSSDLRVTPRQTPNTSQAPTFTESASPPPAVARSGTEAPVPSSAGETMPTAISATALAAASTPVSVRQDLSGTWSGEYVDASGKQLLRVVNLSISHVHGDGGIEGTLQYEATSGGGECKLHPRGSAYSADRQRLQLSPEGCSPHYPRELGVPLDFDGVNPQANTLKDGRIEAPTGELIRVELKRVSG